MTSQIGMYVTVQSLHSVFIRKYWDIILSLRPYVLYISRSQGGGRTTTMLPSLRPDLLTRLPRPVPLPARLSLPLCRLAAQLSQSLARPSPRLRPPPPLDLQPNLSTSSSRSSASLSRPMLLRRPRRSVAPRLAPPVVVL